MKKVLLLISASLACFSLSFAQAPLEMLQKSDNNLATLRGVLELPEGFTYVNRGAAADDKKIKRLGSGGKKLGFHHVGAIELPAKAGQVIKKIVFFTTTTDKHGKLFVASRPASGEYGSYTLELVENFDTTTGMNAPELKAPLTTEDGKVYVVGYEVKSAAAVGDDTSAGYPITLIAQDNVVKEASAFNLMEDGGAIVGEKGASIALLDVTKKYGGVFIIVQGENLASTFGVASELLPSVYSQDGRILIDGAFDSFVVYDASGRLVANNSDTVLPAGTYIVKARTGSLDSVSKVVVK